MESLRTKQERIALRVTAWRAILDLLRVAEQLD